VVVAAGKGIGREENLALIRRLAAIFPKGAVGASRLVCDAGWLPYPHQVGVTGKTVAPKLYLACGISGTIQHVTGMRGSRCIVAINTDPRAAIFQVAHYGIVEDLTTFIPLLLDFAGASHP
jgi:electron transfer flavoprotein alpha subunit